MEPKITIKGTKMTIEVDLSATGKPSMSGKTLVISSTHGNKAIETDGGTVYVGVNVYRKS